MATHKRKKDANASDALNPHMPQFITQAPWYMESADASEELRHQRILEPAPAPKPLDAWYARGQKAGPAARTFRKGACENCGALSHKTRDCVERPRPTKSKAKFSKSNIKEDEVLVDPGLNEYDAKRDRWNGYDPETQRIQIEEWERVEDERRRVREKELEERLRKKQKNIAAAAVEDDLAALSDEDPADILKDDEDKYADAAKAQTSRNLRIREDTAKYLLNLNPESAFYDPKTRSMREDPRAQSSANSNFPGENFYRYTGDVKDMARMQKFAWDAYERGVDVNLQADPTRAALLHKEYEKKKEQVKTSVKKGVLEKYGGEEYLNPPLPRELVMDESETFIEYNQAGQIVRTNARATSFSASGSRLKTESKYVEDDCEKYAPGHTAIWGSYYDLDQGKWGYACCRSLYRKGYCSGSSGVSADSQKVVHQSESTGATKSLKEMHVEKLMQDMREQQDKARIKKRPHDDTE